MRLVIRSALGRPRLPESVNLSIDMLRPAASGELTAIDSGVASTDIGVDGVLLGVMSIPPAPLCEARIAVHLNEPFFSSRNLL